MLKIIWLCFAKIRDNLLVKTAIFAIFEVLFCVTRNAINFIEMKKQEHMGTIQKVLYSPILLFFKLTDLLFPFVSHKKFLIETSQLLSLMFAGKFFLTQISSCVKSLFWKNLARQLLISNFTFMLGYYK